MCVCVSRCAAKRSSLPLPHFPGGRGCPRRHADHVWWRAPNSPRVIPIGALAAHIHTIGVPVDDFGIHVWWPPPAGPYVAATSALLKLNIIELCVHAAALGARSPALNSRSRDLAARSPKSGMARLNSKHNDSISTPTQITHTHLSSTRHTYTPHLPLTCPIISSSTFTSCDCYEGLEMLRQPLGEILCLAVLDRE